MNKTIAGYHMLMILSAVDHKFHIEEEKIIREYLFQEFPFHTPLDNEIDNIIQLLETDRFCYRCEPRLRMYPMFPG